jgi:hypothetical protein
MGLCLPNRACYARCGRQKKKTPCSEVHAPESQGTKFQRFVAVKAKEQILFQREDEDVFQNFDFPETGHMPPTFPCWARLKVTFEFSQHDAPS